MKGSHPRPADRCPFVLGHSISQVTSFMQLGMLCFVQCDLEIWLMSLKNNRALFVYWFKLSAFFQSHLCIQTGFTVRKCQIWAKTDNCLFAWPWNLMDDLEKQQGTFPKQHQALCTISSSYVNSNCSYDLEMAKWCLDLCDLGLWSLTLSFCMDITSVVSNNSRSLSENANNGNIVK